MSQWELTKLEARSEHVVGDRLAWYWGHRMAFLAAEGQAAPLHPLMVCNRSEQATAVESCSTLRWLRCQIS